MSQNTQFNEEQFGYPDAATPNYEYHPGYGDRLRQHNAALGSFLPGKSSSPSWQRLSVALVSLLVLIVIALVVLFSNYNDYYYNGGNIFIHLIALVITSATIIVINVLFNKNRY